MTKPPMVSGVRTEFFTAQIYFFIKPIVNEKNPGKGEKTPKIRLLAAYPPPKAHFRHAKPSLPPQITD
jgi:hypothetical protein